jgi:hypothetical protein
VDAATGRFDGGAESPGTLYGFLDVADARL